MKRFNYFTTLPTAALISSIQTMFLLLIRDGHGKPFVPQMEQTLGTAYLIDDQANVAVGRQTAPYTGGTTTIQWLQARTVAFILETRKIGTNAVVESFHWGYMWDNFASTWNASQGAPHAICAAAFVKSKGQFYNIRGITLLDALN